MAADVTEQIKRLRSPDADTRLEAAEALCALGEQAREAALALIISAADSDERVREAAHGALEEISDPPAVLSSELATALGHENPASAYWAATLRGRMGPEAGGQVTALASVVSDLSAPAEVRQRAAWALGRIGPAARDALPVLKQLQTESDTRLVRLIDDAIESMEG